MEWRGDVPRAALAIPAAVVPCGVVFPLRYWFALPLWCSQGG